MFFTIGPQRHYTGHSISINVDSNEFYLQIPRAIAKLGMIPVLGADKNPDFPAGHVEQNKIKEVYKELVARNPLYKFIDLDLLTLETYPVNG
jgi:hypothetical protein